MPLDNLKSLTTDWEQKNKQFTITEYVSALFLPHTDTSLFPHVEDKIYEHER